MVQSKHPKVKFKFIRYIIAHMAKKVKKKGKIFTELIRRSIMM